MGEVTVTVKCSLCGFKRVIREGEVRGDDYPLCPKDGMPLIAVSAEKKRG